MSLQPVSPSSPSNTARGYVLLRADQLELQKSKLLHQSSMDDFSEPVCFSVCVSLAWMNSGPLRGGFVQGYPELRRRRALRFAEGTGERFNRRDLCSGVHQPRRTSLIGQDCRRL